MENAIAGLLAELDIHPVMLEIGPVGRSPKAWDLIATECVYAGVGPEAAHASRPVFHRTTLLDVVVSPHPGPAGLTFTKHRAFSSLRLPNPTTLSEFFVLGC